MYPEQTQGDLGYQLYLAMQQQLPQNSERHFAHQPQPSFDQLQLMAQLQAMQAP